MNTSQSTSGLPFVATFLLAAVIAVGQQPAQQTQPQAPPLELYHIHVSKAAPGKRFFET